MPWRSTLEVLPDDVGTQDLLDSYGVAVTSLEQFACFVLVKHIYESERIDEERI